MSVNYAALAASDGNGEAVRATVQVQRNIGSTSITVDHTTHWPTGTFIATTGTLLASGKLDPTTVQVFYGTASGTTITISSYAAGYSDLGNKQGDVVVLKPSTEWANGVSTAAQAMNTFVNTNGDWRSVAAPNTVTALGNRSYSMVFNNTDLTPTLSVGMRLKGTRTVTAPTQCTSLNGTTQYYSKTTPAGMTFTNNFVVSAWVKVSSYASGDIAARFDGTSGWRLNMNASGQILLIGYNGGASNNSFLTSYQSVPLNKWVHIAAQLDMATFTATTTTSYCMIDGVDVPVSVTRGGTNPTSLVQAGNLNIGAGNSTNFFPGKLAQVAIYSAKVTQANVLATMAQGLVGTEASLISAYSFNNSINDLNANANNLTANGSAVATNADTPFTQTLSLTGYTNGVTNYGIITAISFSTNTTLTVQVPEGGTIPTTGGVSALAYSVEKVPYGFPAQRGKWTVDVLLLSNVSSSGTSTSTVYNPGGINLNIPIGEWDLTSYLDSQITFSTTAQDAYMGLSTSNSTFNDVELQQRQYNNGLSGAPITILRWVFNKKLSLSVATPYYVLVYVGTAISAMLIAGNVGTNINAYSKVTAELAYL